MILLRSALFEGLECEVIYNQPSILATKLTVKGGYSFCLTGVYRSKNVRSPVFDQEFFEHVEVACNNASLLNIPSMVAGDFNAKIGDARGLYGEVEEFRDLLPGLLKVRKLTR